MNNILGIDLGTNSIGLAVRESDDFNWYGVYTFRKGVGEGKSGEFSFAAERTKHRSTRRLYNSRRYRKWETLKVLIENNYCPLPFDKLNEWKHYRKGIGRIFPVDNIEFGKWIKLDFDGDGIPDYSSPYQLRRELISNKLDLTNLQNRYKVGRALYHIAQRRGFKSSRKIGANEKTAVYKGSNETKTIGRNEYEKQIIENGSLGAAFAYLEDQGIRIRNRYTLRSDYQTEVDKILEHQNITNINFKENVQKAIFFQRPLRSQKGLIGKCTLEPGKPRCPVSHPKYEEYRAWSFINNIKYRTNGNAEFEPLPLPLKEKLYNEKFFLKSRDFEFSQIRKFIKTHGGKDWESNYTHKMDDISVSACPVSARLKSAFGDDWQNFEKTIIRKNKKGEDESVRYRMDDIWHILFSFEDEEYFEEFIGSVLEFDEEQVKELATLFNSFPVGYANLSLKAINNILPFLREGIIYSEAVILAKIPELIGNDLFVRDKEKILEGIRCVIKSNREEKIALSIVNNLIFKYYALDYTERFGWKDSSYQLVESDLKDVETTIKEHFGEKTWETKDERYRQNLIETVTQKYQEFFASSKREHVKLPHLVNQVKQFIADNFEIDEKRLDKIYHPSQIAIYPKKEGQEYLLSPKTAAFKNPMAYKTLYKLRDVINYLIETGKIDADTRVVVEIARELNDSNKRWAIEKYQRDREVENRSFAAAIGELLKEKDFQGLANPESDSDVDKFRIWTEQLEKYDEVKKEINSIENNKKLSVSEKDIQKYRLLKEQNCCCIYTGKIISLTDLFDANKIDFEHTIPRSKSFDNSLANLTVCYADYNRSIKNNRLPVNLPNYENESHGYSAIKPRLEGWEKKLYSLQKQIETQVKNSKYAIDKESKDRAIRERHLLQMEYNYWKNKLDRFTRKEVPAGFVNSQLVDTQIITKYALHYLKTVFDKVDVIKGSITAEFRKIYGIQPKDEIKDRSKHSHHAIDAAVLTLIPSPKKREEILKKAYEYEEQNKKKQYREKPFADFNYSMIEVIQRNILINNIADKDNVLAPGKKNVRKRGRVVWLDKEKKIPKVATGDSVRGQLHLDTFYGKIKIAAKDENGTLIRNESGVIQYEKDKNSQDKFKMAIRKLIDNVNFKTDIIIDNHLAEHLKNQLESGIKQKALKDFNGNTIRHIRCEAKAGPGLLNPENVTIVKGQTNRSKKDYKNYYYTNTGDNYMFGLYENENGRKIISINVLEATRYSLEKNKDSKREIFKSIEPVLIGTGKKAKESNLVHIFISGQKVLFFLERKEELKDLAQSEISNRLYFIKRFHQAERGNIVFQHHLEARSDEELSKELGTLGKNGFSIDKLTNTFSPPRILFTPNKDVFVVEGKDFEMKLDGSIEFKF
ncbi:type II CRISPR RNA-guided endonuclease Cas9 [Parafilimonas sp.]|uniref:type II CRISPR RNA-guided endonuclease Cas9 n=1 Tax=Parafilimonas sp. TaxID=1969739 RepID=UPI003F8054EB